MSVWREALTNDTWRVAARGRLDQGLTPELEQHLLDLLGAGHSRIIVDLSEVTYINSGGLRCLVTAWRKAKKVNGDLFLFGLNSRLQEIFSMIGFDKVFQIYPTLELAQAAAAKEGTEAT